MQVTWRFVPRKGVGHLTPIQSAVGFEVTR